MKARREGDWVILTLTVEEAAELEDELLWCRDGDEWSKKVWETLHDLHG